MPKAKADVASPIDPSLATAKAALAAFKTLCPDLSIFATVLAGRNPEVATGPNCRLTVVPGMSTATDGTKIFIRPDARLAGSPTEKEWSSIKAGLFHEVAHIVFDSFKAVSDADRAEAIKNVTDLMEDSYRRDAILAALASATGNYKSMSEAWHPAMPMLVNALEDARVEACLFLAKPGTHKHLLASRMEIFDAPKAEIEALIGKAWIDRDDDSQAIIGAYIVGAGYEAEGRLSPKIVEILNKIKPTIRRAVDVETVRDVYAQSFAVLSAFQMEGLLRNGDERDEPMGVTDHDEAEKGGDGGEAGSGACAHPKAMIVECASPGCLGNCTLCGSHIVPSPAASSTSGGEGGASTPSSDPEAADGGAEGAGEASDADPRKRSKADELALEDVEHADDAGEIHGRRGGESEGAAGGSRSMDGAASSAGTSADKAEEVLAESEGAETPASSPEAEARARAEAEARREELAKGLHIAGGHDPATDEAEALDKAALERALTLDEHGYAEDEDLTKGITGIKRYATDKNGFTSGGEPLSSYVDLSDAERAINTVMPEMRQVLAVNGRTGFTPNQRAGRIDTRNLYRTATGTTRVFGRYSTPETRDYLFVVALDCSGSMSSGYSADAKLQKSLAYASGETLNRLGVPFIMFGYTGRPSGGGYQIQIQDVRAENQPWDKDAVERLAGLHPVAANLDGSTMQYARIRGRNATRSPKTEVIVIYMNDGGMPAENSRNEQHIIAKEVRDQHKNNVRYVGVGLNSRDAGEAGLELVYCKNVGDVSKLTGKIAEVMGVRR